MGRCSRARLLLHRRRGGAGGAQGRHRQVHAAPPVPLLGRPRGAPRPAARRRRVRAARRPVRREPRGDRRRGAWRAAARALLCGWRRRARLRVAQAPRARRGRSPHISPYLPISRALGGARRRWKRKMCSCLPTSAREDRRAPLCSAVFGCVHCLRFPLSFSRRCPDRHRTRPSSFPEAGALRLAGASRCWARRRTAASCT